MAGWGRLRFDCSVRLLSLTGFPGFVSIFSTFSCGAASGPAARSPLGGNEQSDRRRPAAGAAAAGNVCPVSRPGRAGIGGVGAGGGGFAFGGTDAVSFGLGGSGGEAGGVAGGAGQGAAANAVYVACDALGGDGRRAAAAAAAIELIHNFSLIHDDIQDGDRERRHQPTVWALWGEAKALVCGNGVQSLGDGGLLRTAGQGTPPAITLQVSRLLLEAYLEMIEGQCRDLGFESRTDIGTADYLEMIAGKTGR